MISDDARQTMAALSARYGKSRAYFLLDMLACRLRFGLNSEEYRRFALYEKSAGLRRDYVSSDRRFAYVRRYNDPADSEVLRDKARFNAGYAAFVHRPWLDCRAAGAETILAFLRENPDCMQKPAALYKGIGLARVDAASLADLPAFAASLAGADMLLEARVVQHREMARLNPDSVNTVRLLALRGRDGSRHLARAVLRVGMPGQCIDNFAAGGVVYPLDIDEGIVTAPGVDARGARHVRHPGSGAIVPGFSVPDWAGLCAAAMAAMDVLPAVRYVGWDIAVTPQGVEIIEGNHDATMELFQLCEGQTGMDPVLCRWV